MRRDPRLRQLFRRPVEHDAPAAETDDAIGEVAVEIDLMQRAEHGGAARAGKLAQQRKHLTRDHRIEARHRLVGEQESGFQDQRTRDADPLLLPAGEGHGTAEELALRETHGPAELPGPAAQGGRIPPQGRAPCGHGGDRAGEDVGGDREAFDQVELLMHHRHATPHRRQRVAPHRDPVHHHRAG